MFIDDHILYHGAIMSVPEPLAHIGRSDLDFGPGFYVTNDRNQAIKWANTKAGRKRGLIPILNTYRFDQDTFLSEGNYKMKIFPEYNVEWLDFIAFSRKGQRPWKEFDWIEGGIANDGVISTVDAYIDGRMTPEMAMGELVKEDLRHQVCILNQGIINKYLTFTEAIKI